MRQNNSQNSRLRTSTSTRQISRPRCQRAKQAASGSMVVMAWLFQQDGFVRAYRGDGTGFEPFIDGKLSMGLRESKVRRIPSLRKICVHLRSKPKATVPRPKSQRPAGGCVGIPIITDRDARPTTGFAPALSGLQDRRLAKSSHAGIEDRMRS